MNPHISLRKQSKHETRNTKHNATPARIPRLQNQFLCVRYKTHAISKRVRSMDARASRTFIWKFDTLYAPPATTSGRAFFDYNTERADEVSDSREYATPSPLDK